MGDFEKKSKTSRKWLLTINNPIEHNMDHEQIKFNISILDPVKYWCMCDEEGDECETLHTHVYIVRSSPMRFDTIKKLFPTAHIDKPYGSNQDNRNYIGKFKDEYHKTVDGTYDYVDNNGKRHAGINFGDTFEEFGICPDEHQGKRNDIVDMYQMIKDGASDYEIIEENPKYIRYLDKITKVRDTVKYEQYKNIRRDDLVVEYWYGDTGTGKTTGVFDIYGDSNVYVVSDYRNPWDEYNGEDVVLFDDIDFSYISIKEFQKWIDVFPCKLRSRFSNKIACYHKIFITTLFSPKDLWSDLYRWDTKTFDGIMRRIHVVKRFYAFGKYEVEKQDGFLEVSPEEAARIDTMFGS